MANTLLTIEEVMHNDARCSTTALMPTNKLRISINLTEGEYAQLSALAERHGLSMAWIGHKAIVGLLEKARGDELQLPLLFVERHSHAQMKDAT